VTQIDAALKTHTQEAMKVPQTAMENWRTKTRQLLGSSHQLQPSEGPNELYVHDKVALSQAIIAKASEPKAVGVSKKKKVGTLNMKKRWPPGSELVDVWEEDWEEAE